MAKNVNLVVIHSFMNAKNLKKYFQNAIYLILTTNLFKQSCTYTYILIKILANIFQDRVEKIFLCLLKWSNEIRDII